MSNNPIEAIYPLTPSQQGMLLESLTFPDSGKQVEQLLWQWQGDFNMAAYKRAWQRVLARHTILRTGFLWKNQQEPLQFVLRRATLPISYQDWRSLSAAEQQQKLDAYLAADRRAGFNLTKVPLMHFAVMQWADDLFQMVWSTHHILLDGWGLPIVMGEVMDFYEAECAGRPLHLPPTRPYGDYIVWLQQQDQALASHFWRQRLQGISRPTPLVTKVDPFDVDDQSESSPAFGEHRMAIPKTTLQQMQTLARQNHLTLNTVMQGVWALLLSRYSHHSDVLFGITVSGRPAEIVNIESMVGLFINTVPLRVQVEPSMTLLPWLQRLQAEALAQQPYEYCSAGQIQQWSEVPPTRRLYESLLVFENYPLESSAHAERAATKDTKDTKKPFALTDVYSFGAQTQYPLTITVFPHEKLHIKLVYHRASFDDAHIDQLTLHLQRLLEVVIAASEQSLAQIMAAISSEALPVVRVAQPALASSTPFVPPLNSVQQQLAKIWQEIFGLVAVGIHDNFYDLGGYSMLAIRLIGQIRQHFGLNLPISALLLNPTIAKLAKLIEESSGEHVERTASHFSSVVPIQPNGNKPPFFLAPGGGGTVFYMYYLARYMDPDQPLYGLQALGLDGQSEPHTSVEEMATHFLEAIKEVQPHGPYFLGGHSFGAFMAYEMAQRLIKAGETVAILINFDTQAHHLVNKLTHQTTAEWIHEYVMTFEEVFADKITQPYLAPTSDDEEEQWAHFATWLRANNLMASSAEIETARRLLSIFRLQLTMNYEPQAQGVVPMPMTIFRATDWAPDKRPEKMGWDALQVEPDIHLVPGNHMSFIGEPHIQVVAKTLSACLKAAQARVSP